MQDTGIMISIRPAYVVSVLMAVVFFLHVLSGVAVWAKLAFDGQYYNITEFFDVGIEGNIPTIYSVIGLFIASVTALTASAASKLNRDGLSKYWVAVSIVMLFLAFDEGAMIHEEVGSFFEEYFPNVATGYLYWIWVVPYGIVALLFFAAMFPFLQFLPRRTSYGLVTAGAVFISGAVGVEVVSARIYEQHSEASLRPPVYYLLYSIEEFLEKLGVITFIYFSLDYAAGRSSDLKIQRS